MKKKQCKTCSQDRDIGWFRRAEQCCGGREHVCRECRNLLRLSRQTNLTQEIIKKWFTFDVSLGRMVWSRGRKKGTVAGCINSRGYRAIAVFNRIYLEHRLVWLYHFGEWPAELLDHKDGDKLNNQISNLRAASFIQNGQNSKGRQNTRSGIKGVSWFNETKKWRARIVINGQERSLGYFYDKEDAQSAYAAGAKKYFGEFARLE